MVKGSDAESHVARRFPHKTTKRVGNGLRPTSIRSFLEGLPHLFQRQASKGLDAAYHFTFSGKEEAKATVIIRDMTIRVVEGHQEHADLHVIADGRTWFDFLAKNKKLLGALIRGKIRLKGSPRLLIAFGRCFPT